MVRIITTVAALTMRNTRANRPGYGANSSLRNCRNHPGVASAGEAVEARVAMDLVAANDHHGRFADAKQVGRGVSHADAHREPRCEAHPVQSPLHVWKARTK